MTAMGVLLTFIVFIGVGSVLDAMSRREKDVEHSGLYRHARSATKA